MVYELSDTYTAIAESGGILQNRTIHPVELITTDVMPERYTPGLIIRPGENFRFACANGKTAYARCVSGVEAWIVIDDCVNFKQPASDGADAGAAINDNAITVYSTWSSHKINAMVGAGEQSILRQVTKLGVTAAPKNIEIPINHTTAFALPAVEVLKFIKGAQDVVTTVCAFDNADADDFNVGGKSGDQADYVAFDGVMRLVTTYDIPVSTPAVLGDGFISESDEIDFADYKVVNEVV